MYNRHATDEKYGAYYHNRLNDDHHSAGVRGLQFKIAPADLIKYTRGIVADIAVPITEEVIPAI